MTGKKLTMRELLAPDLDQPLVCIDLPPLPEDSNFQLKAGVINLLPSFHGSRNEDPIMFLKEFHMVCTSMKPAGITDEQIKMRAFYFTLKDSAKNWFFCLPAGSVSTWNEILGLFLEKYFPTARIRALRHDIRSIEQQDSEPLCDYWERYVRLCARCPYHKYSDHDIISFFYEGLLYEDRLMLNAASGGAFLSNTPDAARELIENMAIATNRQWWKSSDNGVSKCDGNSVSTTEEDLRQYRQSTNASIQSLGDQMRNIAMAVSELIESHSNVVRLPQPLLKSAADMNDILLSSREESSSQNEKQPRL